MEVAIKEEWRLCWRRIETEKVDVAIKGIWEAVPLKRRIVSA
jgi:hypothetical protein